MKQIFQNKLLSVASLIIFIVVEISAQTPSEAADEAEDYTWWYAMLFVLAIGLVGALVWRQKAKKVEKAIIQQQKDNRKNKDENHWEMASLDADKELEWLRKNQNLMDRKRKKTAAPTNPTQKTSSTALPRKNRKAVPKKVNKPVEDEKAPEFTIPLPIFSIQRLELARPFPELPISDDESLLSAIEQSQEDFDEEEDEVRELTVKVLAAFKTRNSAEALAQFAHYDLSSGLRSKAVAALTEFDHETVFKPILLSCADPSREVRAAAARGLFRLNFDRADAWTRIAESGEEGRMRQAARAAMEADLVQRSFDRLIHHDYKIAYEAFALTALLIAAGETDSIFEAVENHKDINVRRALLHVIKITKNQKAHDRLYAMLDQPDLPRGVRNEIEQAIEEMGYVSA